MEKKINVDVDTSDVHIVRNRWRKTEEKKLYTTASTKIVLKRDTLQREWLTGKSSIICSPKKSKKKNEGERYRNI